MTFFKSQQTRDVLSGATAGINLAGAAYHGATGNSVIAVTLLIIGLAGLIVSLIPRKPVKS